MRTLPPAPNLEHLKQQAKDLLASLREDDSRATLSDAQRALAQQYGCRTWADLKAEVERIASAPETFDADIAAAIAASFGLGEMSEPPRLISSLGVGGPSVRLRTDSGSWHAFGVLSSYDEELAEQTIRLMDGMRDAGVAVPVAVRTTAGDLIAEVGEQPWRVDGWTDIGPTIATPVSRAYAFEAGKLLATMHRLDIDPVGGVHPWLAAKPRGEAVWRDILETLRKRQVPWVDAVGEALPAILDISRAHVDAPESGLVVAHTDFQPSSTHIGPGGRLSPLGWDFAGAISPDWHIGMVLDSWCSLMGGGINEKAARAILDGYGSVAGTVPPLDISSFSPVITAWLNWLVRQMNVTLGASGRARESAERDLAYMLAHPKGRARFERLLQAAGTR